MARRACACQGTEEAISSLSRHGRAVWIDSICQSWVLDTASCEIKSCPLGQLAALSLCLAQAVLDSVNAFLSGSGGALRSQTGMWELLCGFTDTGMARLLFLTKNLRVCAVTFATGKLESEVL